MIKNNATVKICDRGYELRIVVLYLYLNCFIVESVSIFKFSAILISDGVLFQITLPFYINDVFRASDLWCGTWISSEFADLLLWSWMSLVITTASVNSLAPGRFQFNLRLVIFKLTLVNGGWGISCKIAHRWLSLDLTDDKSTLVQVMTWCRQAKCHYLNQCWLRSMSPNGVTRPQWVKCKGVSPLIDLYISNAVK